MSPIAQAVAPNTWRVVGDRMDVREFYIPDNGSARSRQILGEAMRSFGIMPMHDGGVNALSRVDNAAPVGVAPINIVINGVQVDNADEVARVLVDELRHAARGGVRR